MGGPNGEFDPDDYVWPLPEVPGAPVPSQADYSPQNVAPLIESFAQFVNGGTSPLEIAFVYENNTPNDTGDDITVTHPNDDQYLPDYLAEVCPGSTAMDRYEQAAKKSERLKTFQDTSPAGIEYFQDPNPNC